MIDKTLDEVIEMVVFVAKQIYNKMSDRNRVRVIFYSSREPYSLDAGKIETIFYDSKAYYIVYKTSNTEFYKQKFGDDITERPYGKEVKFEVKESDFVCPHCGNLTEVDDWAMYTDEGLTWCPYCGKYVHPVSGKVFVYETPEVGSEDLAKQFAEEKGLKIQKLAVAQGIEKAKVIEERELPSGVIVEIVEGTLVQYDLHAWMDGINAIEKELGKVKAVRVSIPGNFGYDVHYYVIKEE